MGTNALHGQKRPAQGAAAPAGRAPASLGNAAMGVFGSNPKVTGGLGRHFLLLSSTRPLVLASSAAAIGAPGHPFAFASIALTGPSFYGVAFYLGDPLAIGGDSLAP